MKNYQLIDLLKLVVVFFLGYLFLYHYVPWNLEKNPKKVSEKFRKLNVKIFSAAIFGFFLLYGGLRWFEVDISFLHCFFYYYLSLFAITFIMGRQLAQIRKYEYWKSDVDNLIEFQWETDIAEKREKICDILYRLIIKKPEGQMVYEFWSMILNGGK